jgi:hypothetical protein
VKEKGLQDIVVYHPTGLLRAKCRPILPMRPLSLSRWRIPASPVSKTIPNKLISSLAYGRVILASIGGDGRTGPRKGRRQRSLRAKNPRTSRRASTNFAPSVQQATFKKWARKTKPISRLTFDFDKVMDQLVDVFKILQEGMNGFANRG